MQTMMQPREISHEGIGVVSATPQDTTIPIIEDTVNETSSLTEAERILERASRVRRQRRRRSTNTLPLCINAEESHRCKSLRNFARWKMVSNGSAKTQGAVGLLGPKTIELLNDEVSVLDDVSFDPGSVGEIENTRQNDEEPSSTASRSSSTTYGTETIPEDDIFSKKLLKYGIVPLEKKSIHGFKASRSTKSQVEEVHRWLFVEGGHFDSVEALMKNYCVFVRDLGIPVDRMFYGGIGLHPRLTAFTWKWTPDEFVFREMPPEVFERRFELMSPHEPFCILEKGEADYVRIRKSDKFIAPDTASWFRPENYTDYFALPDIHRSESKGSLAWSTKDPNGFGEEHIAFFELTLPALTTVLRTHTNDLALRTLTHRMEEEIKDRTQELAEANLKLTQANNQLEIQSQKQLQHFACMSHEIRTPLNCIVGISSLLLESPEEISQSVTESIQMVNTSAELLSAVVDDVLDYSKMESGVFEVDIKPTNLQENLTAVVHAMQEKAAKNDVHIETFFAADLPYMVQTDGRRLQQILYNLIGNACKFSKKGGKVECRVSLNSHNESLVGGASPTKRLTFAIKDYGKGIDQADFQAIFQPFNQAGKETATVYGGTGLGLSITSSLVDRLGGCITVDSKLGEYAEFTVELPFEDSDVPDEIPKLRGCLVDTTIVTLVDDADVQILLSQEVIQHYALDVAKARNLEDFLKQRSLAGRHCVLVLPVEELDSICLFDLRKRAKTVSIVTHGSGRRPNIAGLHWQSPKGVFPMTAIRDFFILKNKEESVWNLKVLGSEHNPTLKAPVVEENYQLDPAEPDHETPRVLIAEDNKINQKVLGRVLTRLGIDHFDIVENGQMAVDACAMIPYSLVLMDVQMPIMDGFEATSIIKSPNFPHSPKVVFCTAHAVEDFRKQADSLGGDGFVSKPFNVKKIGDCLKEHLGYYRSI